MKLDDLMTLEFQNCYFARAVSIPKSFEVEKPQQVNIYTQQLRCRLSRFIKNHPMELHSANQPHWTSNLQIKFIEGSMDYHTSTLHKVLLSNHERVAENGTPNSHPFGTPKGGSRWESSVGDQSGPGDRRAGPFQARDPFQVNPPLRQMSHTVDGWNPAPVYIPGGVGFLPSTVSFDKSCLFFKFDIEIYERIFLSKLHQS